MATTSSVGSGRRKRKSIVGSEGSSQQKETNKRKKHVEEQFSSRELSCVTSTKEIINEVNFKTKPKQLLSAVEPASYDEAGPSGLQQITSVQDSPPSLPEEQNEDVDGNKFQQLSRYKNSGIKTKKSKSFLCPKCGKGFTSKNRLIQGHYDEETQTCRYELEAAKKCLCPSCGNYVFNLQGHYNEETKSCKRSKYSTEKISEEELYATLTEDVTVAERNAVWRSILKHFKILKCQNCNHKANSVAAMKYHVERCGKVAEKLSCPVCDRCYTTKPGLDYHMGTQHQLHEKLPDESQAETTMSKRKAAVKAAVHIAKVSTDISSEDVSQTVTDKQSNSSSAIEDKISGTDWETIRNALKNGQEVKCPSPHCSLMFRSISGFRYHVSRCKENKTLTCVLCKKQLTTWQRFQNHMMKIHGIGEEDSLDYEYSEVTADDDNDDEGEEVKKQRTQWQAQSKKPFYHTINSLETAYQQQLKKLVEELTSHEELFTDWQPSLRSWIRCNPRECAQYAPVAGHSMRYCFANSKHGTSPVSRLTLFDAALEDGRYGVTSGAIFNVGGPVWSMAWAPSGDESPSNIQYIAMAAYRTLDETYRMDIPLKHNGLVQLWSTTLSDQPQLPRLSLGIAHDYGCVRSMKWCPSGCAAKLTPTIDNSEMLSRLGLLALACSDAVVRILSIPYPDTLLGRLDPIKQHDDDDDDDVYNVFVMPKSICCLLSPSNITNQSNFSTLYGQCMDVEWLPRQPHNKIAACFSNGTVVIWDLLATSWLLRGSHDHCDAVFYPQEHINAHFGNICRTMSWCADDPDFLFTAGYDRRLCLWDLKYPDEPVDKWDRGWCLDSKWPLLSPGVFCLEDCITCSKNDSLIRNLYFHEFQTGKPASIIRSVNPQISFSYCHWKSAVAFGTIDGSVMLKRLPPFIYFFRRPKHGQKGNPQVLCFCAQLSADEEGENNDVPSSSSSSTDNTHLTFYNFPQEKEHQLEYKPDMDPVTAITKVSWNPHHQYCDWLLVATNAGLVRLLKPSS